MQRWTRGECSNCSERSSVLWVRRPEGDELCQLCRTYNMRHDGKNRPAKVIQMTKELERRKTRRKEVSAMSSRTCSNCSTQETRLAIRPGRELLCTRCHRYAESKPGQNRPSSLEKRRLQRKIQSTSSELRRGSITSSLCQVFHI